MKSESNHFNRNKRDIRKEWLKPKITKNDDIRTILREVEKPRPIELSKIGRLSYEC